MAITSSDPSFLRNATRNDGTGIAFLGAIVRGYFDDAADIDAEASATRDMAQRWAFSESRIMRGDITARNDWKSCPPTSAFG
jgi:hypothetical protein